MLTYLLGDVIRIFAGDFEEGKINGVPQSQGMWLLIACIMMIPIVMIVMTLTIPYPAIRSMNIMVSVALILFNLAGLPYKGLYDNFLIAFSFILNLLLIWFAWNW